MRSQPVGRLRFGAALRASLAAWLALPCAAAVQALPPYDLDAMRARLGHKPAEVREASMPYLEPGAPARRQDVRAAARMVGLSYAVQGNYAQGIRFMQTAFDLAREDQDRRAMAAAKNNLGAMLKSQGRLPEAVAALRTSALLAESEGDVNTWVSALGNLSNLMGEYNNHQAALDLSLRAQTLLETHGGRAPQPLAYVSRAEMYHFLGREAEALRSLQLADALLPADDPLQRAAWSAVKALVQRAQGRDAEAEASARQCIDLIRTARIEREQSFDCEHLLASIFIARGDAPAARERITVLEEMLRSLPDGPGVGRLRRQRELHVNLAELAALENRGVDAARYQAVVGQLDRQLSAARESSGAALAAAEFLEEGKDISIALLEERNAHLALQARQDRWLAIGSGAASVLVIVVAGLSWRIVLLRRARQREQAVLDERARLARDLHDTLLQSLAAVSLQIQVAARQARQGSPPVAELLGSIEHQLSRGLAQARLGIWRLRNVAVEAGDLAHGLRQWIDETLAGQGVLLHVEAPANTPRLSADDAENLLRFAQEAVANALRHGRPTRVEVRLTLRPEAWNIEITDDGLGFDVDAVAGSATEHWGLPGMRERIEQVGGRLVIESSPGQGTRIRAEGERRS